MLETGVITVSGTGKELLTSLILKKAYLGKWENNGKQKMVFIVFLNECNL